MQPHFPHFFYAHALSHFKFLTHTTTLTRKATISLFLSYKYNPSLVNTYTHVHEAIVLPFLTCPYANTISLSLDHTIILTHISTYSHNLSHIHKHSLTNTYTNTRIYLHIYNPLINQINNIARSDFWSVGINIVFKIINIIHCFVPCSVYRRNCSFHAKISSVYFLFAMRL